MADLDELIAEVLTAGENIIRESSGPIGDMYVQVDLEAWSKFLDSMKAINNACPDGTEDISAGELLPAMLAAESVTPISPLQFLCAGKAVFNLLLPDETHFTYRVNKADKRQPTDEDMWFVNLGYAYADQIFMGLMRRDPNGDLVLNRSFKSKVGADAPSWRTFTKFLQCLNFGHALAGQGLEFQHAGRCCVCSRELTNPRSVAMGIGPECEGKMGI